MGTYNTAIYGGLVCTYGGAITLPGSPSVIELDILTADMISIEFSESMKVNDALKDPASYTVVGVGTPDLVIKEVRVGNSIFANIVYLVVEPISVGFFYDVRVVGAGIRSVDNQTMTAPTGEFVKARRTKIDSMLSSRPRMYDLRPKSILRNVLSALGAEDDRIGP